MKNFLSKLSSRKFIACLIGVGVGIATTFGVDGGIITDVAGLVVTLISSISYMIVEGKIDKTAINTIIDTIEEFDTVIDVETDEV